LRTDRAFRIGLAGLVLLAGVACRQDMHNQPKYRPYRASTFFEDGMSARVPVEGTVPRGHLNDDELLMTGFANGEVATVFPFPVDAEVMARGQEMFNAYCAVCHGLTGEGDGMVVQRGFTKPPTLVDDRMLSTPEGYFFNVITNGFGAMPDHAAQIKVDDRWAIVAYLRALQGAANATIEDVPPAERAALQ
jgi:mono/diheme cytochrome c family protein